MKLPELPGDADLYRFDGRFYDLSEADGVLTLQLRRSVVWDRCVVGVVTSVVAITVLFLLVSRVVGITLSTFLASTNWGKVVFELCLFLFIGFKPVMAGEIWILDKNTGRVDWKTTKGTQISELRTENWRTVDGPYLSEIASVTAWRHGAKFHLGAKMRSGLLARFGRFGFCRSEHAWRHDATQIAAFLGVPLDIPPV